MNEADSVSVEDANIRLAFERYVSARAYVIASGFESEMEWQSKRDLDALSESDFLREAAWVILSSGMSEATVRRKFAAIEKAFCNFQSATLIVEHRHRCLEEARLVFNHRKKTEAIVSVAVRVALEGFQAIWTNAKRYGPKFLTSFDFIGPITGGHLAKNLGMLESKADRHLQRIAIALGFPSVVRLCSTLSSLSGDSVPVVDIVMWRFATLRRDYGDWFRSGMPRERTGSA